MHYTYRNFTAIAATVLLAALPADALTVLGTGVDGEETALAIGALIAQGTQAAVTFGDILAKTQEGIKVAQETAGLLRSASEVVVDIEYLNQNPDKIFDDAQASFGASFPQLEGIAHDVEAARSNIAGEHAGDRRGLLDLMTHARQTQQGVYQSLMALDNLTDGALGEYLRDMKLAQSVAMAAQDIRQAAQGPLDAKTATILTAKAAAISATAQSQSAVAALETSRILKQQYVNQTKKELGEDLAKSKNAADLAEQMPADEDVDGLELLRRDRAKNP